MEGRSSEAEPLDRRALAILAAGAEPMNPEEAQ
jgi:hypothetical protein